MTSTLRPTPDHPAKWLPVRDLVLGDVVVTNHAERGATGRVTALVPQPGGRVRVVVDGRVYYPHSDKNGKILVLR